MFEIFIKYVNTYSIKQISSANLLFKLFRKKLFYRFKVVTFYLFEFWLAETIFTQKTNPFFILGYGTATCDCDDIHMDRFEKPPCTLYSLKASYVMVIFGSFVLHTNLEFLIVPISTNFIPRFFFDFFYEVKKSR